MQNLTNKHRIQISFNSIYWLSLCARQYMLGTMKKRYKYERIISMQNWNFKSWLFSLADSTEPGCSLKIYLCLHCIRCVKNFLTLWNEWLFAWVGKNKSQPSILVVKLETVEHMKLQGYLNRVILLSGPPFLLWDLS